MFDLIPFEVFNDVLQDHFGVLHDGYIEDLARDAYEDLRLKFDGVYEPCFLIIDNESGRPMSTEIITERRTADECARVCGSDASVGILLLTR